MTQSALHMIGDDTLENWQVIGSGGFGQIHKARHKRWGMDVAIKLLHYDDGDSLMREAALMQQGSSPHVLRVMGVYKGRPHDSACLSSQLGLVMEFMERGSLAALQDALREPPPWSLVFRLAHEVAQGMTYLHQLSPPLLHLDLKPSNVLLDDNLKAKLTDFGLSRYWRTHSSLTKKGSCEEGGTTSYMPPEAFDLSYKATFASDIYSYGILLWSIMTGKQPYADAMASMVRFRIPEGDRPSLAEVNPKETKGLKEFVELMQTCWDPNAGNRPCFLECSAVTETLYKMHKQHIIGAVLQVLHKMGSEVITSGVTSLRVSTPSPRGITHNQSEGSNHLLTGPAPTQETGDGLMTSKQSRKDGPSPSPVQETHAHSVSSLAHPISKASSITSSHWKKLEKISPAVNQSHIQKSLVLNLNQKKELKQHQVSTPVGSSDKSFSISMSDVTGFQLGDKNIMLLQSPGVTRETRQRHFTAPSSVNQPTQWPRKQNEGPGKRL